MAEYDMDLPGVVIAHCRTHGNYIYAGAYIPGIACKRCPKCLPWIPTPAQMQQLRADLDLALNSDFRVMVLGG